MTTASFDPTHADDPQTADEFTFSEDDTSITRDLADLLRYAQKKGLQRPELAFCRTVGGPYPAPARGPQGTPLPTSGAAADWVARNITRVNIPQLSGKHYAAPYDAYGTGTHTQEEYDRWMKAQATSSNTVKWNVRAVNQLTRLWQEWERRDLLRYVIFEIGFWVPRYQRKKGGGNAPISNHAYGTAFDINSDTNGYRKIPSARGAWGCVLPLVPYAIDQGFYWGGFYKDGMHFEVAKLFD